MPLSFTKQNLVHWAGVQVLKEAEAMVAKGLVLKSVFEPPVVHGDILWNNRPLKAALTLHPDNTVESDCPCYANRERGVICPHVIAIAVDLIHRSTDPMREAKYQDEIRRAKRLESVPDNAYLTRVPPNTPGSHPARLILTLNHGWLATPDSIPLSVTVECRDTQLPIQDVATDLPLVLEGNDEALLFVLEDICEGPVHSSLSVSTTDFLNILRLRTGNTLDCEAGPPKTVNAASVTTLLKMDLDEATGAITLNAHTELPFLDAPELPHYLIAGTSGWAYGADNFWPLENLLPRPYHAIYAEPVVVQRPDVLQLIHRELPVLEACARMESSLSPDLFTIEPARPSFRLLARGSPASLSATLYARYGDLDLVAGKPDAREHFGIPDPHDMLRYTVRNPAAEQRALDSLRPLGFSGPCGDDLGSIIDNRAVLNFLGSSLPLLRRRGWRVELQGKVAPYIETLEFATPVVHVHESNANWFDIGFDYEAADGQSISSVDIQQALRKGDSFLRRGDRTVLIDQDAIDSMQAVFTDCESGESNQPGCFRLPSIYAPFVKSSLDSLDGIDIEDTPSWRDQAARLNRSARLEDVALGPDLERTLRPYQKDGVNWLRFMESSGFCGLLADEMGLGKTVQTLVWLQLTRINNACRNQPALIVCPTSLVENWEEEAHRFVPGLRVMTLMGPERKERIERLEETDIAITSYALLRRDIDVYGEREFSIAVLDEAQHIKNRSTQNALAAKRIRAAHRLVLTGTPVENGVSDLWSIMDFLMPGYLASHRVFREHYEIPISHGGPEADVAQANMRRKIHPFLLRRLKTQVAKELPPKIEKIQTCLLTRDQKAVYQELLKASQRKINGLVATNGFNASRMEILTLLMRLRQACCHLDLLKLPDLKANAPSAKLDAFLELLDEAMDSGHRVLVFSQFVSMLKIIRTELEARSLSYCYLDGSTKERLKVVHKFNTERDIPVFLISLKAGGTGLNLTGADMVVHFDPWWNPAVENQATDRAYRIGQKRTVYSIKLIAGGTVEEKVLQLQKRKQAVIDATIESDESAIHKLSWEDIQGILQL